MSVKKIYFKPMAYLLPVFFLIVVGLVVNYYRPTNILKRAIKNNDTEMVFKALQKGADVTTTIIEDVPSHIYAFNQNMHDVFNIMLENGLDANISYSNGDPLGAIALRKQSFQMLELLLNAGLNTSQYFGKTKDHTIFTEAINGQYKSLFAVDLMLPYTSLNHKDGKGMNALNYTVAMNDLSLTECLLYNGANPNMPDRYGRMLLHDKAQSREMVTVLANGGANLNAMDNSGNTPLHTNTNFHILKTLLDNGADVNMPNNCGATPSFYQVAYGNTGAYKLLTKEGANNGVMDSLGNSILVYAQMQESELLRRDIEKDFCKFYPNKCNKAKRHLKNSGVAALATIAYTTTAHRAITATLAKNAGKRAGKRAAAGGIAKVAGRGLLRLIPVLGWVYTGAELLAAASEYEEMKQISQDNRIRLKALEKERKEARAVLRNTLLYCGEKAQESPIYQDAEYVKASM